MIGGTIQHGTVFLKWLVDGDVIADLPQLVDSECIVTARLKPTSVANGAIVESPLHHINGSTEGKPNFQI